MTIELSKEKESLLQEFETVTLPSLSRTEMIEHILKYVYAHIGIQQKLRGNRKEIRPENSPEFISTKAYLQNPNLSEATVRSTAIEAYETYLRSLQHLSLIVNKENN